MLVVLQVVSDGAPGRRVQLRADQVLRVGRSGWADFSVADDQEMIDQHFEVRCAPAGCIVRALNADAPTRVNGEPVASAVVYDGDTVLAGRTTFAIRIEGGPARPVVEQPDEAPAPDAPAAAPVAAGAALGLIGLCAYLDFSDGVKAKANKLQTTDDLIDELTREENFPDALRLRAYLLEKRLAVWWACCCLREKLDAPLPTDQASCVDATAEWVEDPSEAHRRGAEAEAAKLKYSGPGAILALSAFWSDGSLAPEGSPDVEPDDRLTSQGVAAALITAAHSGDPTLAAQKFRSFLDLGKKVAAGEAPLPARANA